MKGIDVVSPRFDLLADEIAAVNVRDRTLEFADGCNFSSPPAKMPMAGCAPRHH